ncbi:DUF2306 domain-containing protein [Tateyamaria sp. SN6-1]|uniref:DUF2306 domain-containing protein n=1 Tax=Tateyamaria sp. SN6-1 TaxID=3092148 RepID=UPI0039F568BB
MMTLDPLLSASPAIQIHVVLALLALVLGPIALWRKRRDRLHKTVGYVWILAMGGAAIGSFAISSHFSPLGLGPIHLLSVYALTGIVVGLRAIWRRDVATHKQVMQNMYVRGVALAGAFNFLPGRTMQRSLIPEVPELGYVIIALVVVWAFAPVLRPKAAARA